MKVYRYPARSLIGDYIRSALRFYVNQQRAIRKDGRRYFINGR